VVPDSDKDSCSNTPDIGDVTRGLREEIEYYSTQQEEQTKSFLQAVSDSQRRYWQGFESLLIFWLGAIAIIVVACAGVLGLRDGLVIGAVLIGFVVVGRAYLWTRFIRKRMKRFYTLMSGPNFGEHFIPVTS
jgi:hypothetical protein